MLLRWINNNLFNTPIRQLYHQLSDEKPLALTYPGTATYQLVTIGRNEGRPQWQRGLLVIKADTGVQLYAHTRETSLDYSCVPGQLRWFGRPEKYNRDKSNEIVIHAEIDGVWKVARIRLNYYQMQNVVRALKAIATPEQVTAYRRKRPYVHFGPLTVQPGEQDLYGVWHLAAPLTLYLTPSHVVLLNGERVQRILPVNELTRIEARPRMDATDGSGLARFLVGEETLAYATLQFEPLAMAIAEAAKRSLEAPLVRKGKKKEDDDEDEDE